MAYQQFYGNPYSPGVAAGVMEGAREQTQFVRNVQRAQLRAENRRMALAEAQFEWQKDESQRTREREEQRYQELLQQKMDAVSQARRIEEIQQRRFEQQHQLDIDKFNFDVKQLENLKRVQEEARQQEAELDRLEAQGEVEKAKAEQLKTRLEEKKAQGDQFIRSLQANAVPVPSEYQLQEGEFDYVNPLLNQRFVIRAPGDKIAPKYNEYEKQSIRNLTDDIDALNATIETKRQRAEELETKAGVSERLNQTVRAKEERALAKGYRDDIDVAQKSLRELNLRRAELTESANPDPINAAANLYSINPEKWSSRFGAYSLEEVLSKFLDKDANIKDAIKYLTENGFISPRR